MTDGFVGAAGKSRIRRVLQGLLALLVVFILVGGYLYQRASTTLRWGMAECLNWTIANINNRFALNEGERRDFRLMTAQAAGEIASGTRSIRDGFRLLRELETGRVGLALLTMGFRNRYYALEGAQRPLESEAEPIFLEFSRAVRAGKISRETALQLRAKVTEEHVIYAKTPSGLEFPDNIVVLKSGFEPSEAKGCLEWLRLIAGQARPFPETASAALLLSPVEEMANALNENRGQ